MEPTTPQQENQDISQDVPQPPVSESAPLPEESAEQVPQTVTSGGPKRPRKKLWICITILVLIAAGGLGWWALHKTDTKPAQQAKKTAKTATANVEGLQLDPKKNYGDKYAKGILPVGDGKYSADTAKQGVVYTCSQYTQNLKSDNAGADSRGPWFTNNNTEYDINKKAHVSGSVSWQPSFSNAVNGNTRVITTNDLPSHTTGVFPIAASDAAYSYDRNPNTIKAQSFSYNLSVNPSYGSPNCMGGQVGVMLTGVAIFNGFDAGGRDAGAWEVQDSCSGHPEKQGEYHYHTLSSCIKDTSVHTVIGYALDGFPISGPQVGSHNILTTSDLDECHGIVSDIKVDGKDVTTYHYVMTQDFPYSASCFRAKASDPPGLQGGGSQQANGQVGGSGPMQPAGGPPPPRR